MPSVPLVVRHDRDDPGAAELYVDVLVDGRSVRMLFDTGASSSRIPADASTHAFLRTDDDEQPGRGALGEGASATPRVIAPSLEIGGIRVESLAVEFAEPTPEHLPAILGLDVLRSHRLDVRFADARIALDGEAAVDAEHPLVQSSRGHPHVDVEFAHGGTARDLGHASSRDGRRSCVCTCPSPPVHTARNLAGHRLGRQQP